MAPVARFSWWGFASLIMIFGASIAIGFDHPLARVAGLVSAVIGTILSVRVSMVSVAQPSSGRIKIVNVARSECIELSSIVSVGSRIVQTPLTRAMGWNQLTLTTASGKKVPLMASTGASVQEICRFIKILEEDRESPFEIDFSKFRHSTGRR